jgi:hypothetical protein
MSKRYIEGLYALTNAAACPKVGRKEGVSINITQSVPDSKGGKE